MDGDGKVTAWWWLMLVMVLALLVPETEAECQSGKPVNIEPNGLVNLSQVLNTDSEILEFEADLHSLQAHINIPMFFYLLISNRRFVKIELKYTGEHREEMHISCVEYTGLYKMAPRAFSPASKPPPRSLRFQIESERVIVTDTTTNLNVHITLTCSSSHLSHPHHHQLQVFCPKFKTDCGFATACKPAPTARKHDEDGETKGKNEGNDKDNTDSNVRTSKDSDSDEGEGRELTVTLAVLVAVMMLLTIIFTSLCFYYRRLTLQKGEPVIVAAPPVTNPGIERKGWHHSINSIYQPCNQP